MSTTKTKNALVSSVFALILCFSMLIGTTYAWFTDSVTSMNNTIVAGNLDVEMKYLAADGTWKSVGENTNLFMENALWEPGHTETVYLKIINNGSLAFNYKLGVNIVEEVASVNVNDDDFKLSSFIMMGAVNDQSTAYPSRDDALNALDVNAVAPISKGYVKEGTLYPKNNTPMGGANEQYVALVVYMPETVGNEANYKKGADVPTIKLGVNLLATQETYEKDSFDDKYDAGANTALPPVPVEKFTIDELDVYDVFNAGASQTTLTNVTLDIYSFIATDYEERYPMDEYKNWTCDFFVSTNSPVDEGLILAGNYSTFGWIGFWVPENDQAYEPVGLLGVVTNGGESNWTYEEIHDIVQIFRCGLIDYNENNSGVDVTVELRMTSPDKTQTITVSSITVTLGQ